MRDNCLALIHVARGCIVTYNVNDLAISTLVVRSYNEDKYGVVQQNLGEIIGPLMNLQEVSAASITTAHR